MAEQFLELVDVGEVVTVRLDGTTATVSVGGDGHEGAHLRVGGPDGDDGDRFLAGADGTVVAGGPRASGVLALVHGGGAAGGVPGATVVLRADDGSVSLSVFEAPGTVAETVAVTAADASVRAGGGGVAGGVLVGDADGRVRVALGGADASVRAGGTGAGGSLRLDDAGGRPRLVLDAQDATLRLRLPPSPGGLTGADPQGPVTVELHGDRGHAVLGGPGTPGSLAVATGDGVPTIELSGAEAVLRVGTADGQFGTVSVENRAGTPKITLNGESGRVSAEQLRARTVVLVDEGGEARVALDGAESTITVGFGRAGHVVVRDDGGVEGVHLRGDGTGTLGATGRAGRLDVLDGDGETAIRADGATGRLRVEELVVRRELHVDGDLSLAASGGARTIRLLPDRGTALLGGNGKDGDVALFHASTDDPDDLEDATIHLNGQTGDIVLQNGDCAEEFDAGDGARPEAGELVVIAHDGTVRPSRTAYDTKVAGIVAGAADRRPGIVLGRARSDRERVPVALAGRVHCRVDARRAPVDVGDLLVSSDTAGHAMKATDRSRVPGAIVGKALARLPAGTGLVPVLVTLG